MPQLPELRLAFAMGGGVSLGVFSGAALGEALKMAVLSTVEFQGKPATYSRVTVDVFSGASAGSLTLALMLRSLLAPPAFALPTGPLVHPSWDEYARWAAAHGLTGHPWDRTCHAALALELGETFVANLAVTNPNAHAGLIAAQRVLLTQQYAWRDAVTIDLLLGKQRSERTVPPHVAGLFDRGSIDALAASVLSMGPSGMEGRSLLGERVLYACTLAKVVPELFDARGEFGDSTATRLALSDGLTSLDRSDVRVFDLRFGAEAARTVADEILDPARWVRARDGAEIPGFVDSLSSASFWTKIRKTAVASGCVPFAFEPITLERSWYELKPSAPPAGFDPTNPVRQSRNDVCYDGGTFNNEPIREAFRMASFQDSVRNDADFVRRVVFIDPNATEMNVSRQVKIMRTHTRDATGGWQLTTTGDRLVAHIGPMITALWEQGRIVEGDRIAQTRQSFAQRVRLRQLLAMGVGAAQTANAAPLHLAPLAQSLAAQLMSRRKETLLPAGGLDLALELRRVILEERAGVLSPLAQVSLDQIPRDAAAWAAASHPYAWLLAMQFIELDLALDLVGKHSEAKLIGICPVDPASVPSGSPQPDQLQSFDLLGAGFFGFGGFCSATARDFDGRLGAACARYFVSLDQEASGMGGAAGMLPTMPREPMNIWPAPDGRIRHAAAREIAAALPDLKSRLKDVAEGLSAISNRNLIVRNIALMIVDSLIDDLVRSGPAEGADLEFIILVPGPGYVLHQPGIFERNDPAVNERGLWLLRTFAKCVLRNGTRTWEGPHVDSNEFTVKVPGGRPDHTFPLERVDGMTDLEYAAWERRVLGANAASVLVNDALVSGHHLEWKVRESSDFPG